MTVNTTTFIPSNNQELADVLFYEHHNITAMGFYDFCRLVEDFVLSETVYLPISSYGWLKELNKYTPNGDAVLANVYGVIGHILGHKSDISTNESDDAQDINQQYSDLERKDGEIGFKQPNVINKILNARKYIHQLLLQTNQALIINKSDLLREKADLLRRHDDLLRENANLHLHNLLTMPERCFGDGDLLIEEDQLSNLLINLYDKLSDKNISLSPGIGFVDVLENINTIKQYSLYAQVAKQLKVDLDAIRRHTNLHYVYIPPFTSILLNRCRDRSDLPKELCKMRIEFAELRNNATRYEIMVSEAESIRDKVEIITELESSQEALSKKLAGNTQLSIVKRTWDIVKVVQPSKIAVNIGDALLDYDNTHKALNRSIKYVSLYEEVNSIDGYGKLIDKIFGKYSFSKSDYYKVSGKIAKYIV